MEAHYVAAAATYAEYERAYALGHKSPGRQLELPPTEPPESDLGPIVPCPRGCSVYVQCPEGETPDPCSRCAKADPAQYLADTLHQLHSVLGSLGPARRKWDGLRWDVEAYVRNGAEELLGRPLPQPVKAPCVVPVACAAALVEGACWSLATDLRTPPLRKAGVTRWIADAVDLLDGIRE